MVFFLNADEKVYARYGGRDAIDPDNRQSLAGLHYTMESVLAMHERKDKVFAPRKEGRPRTIRDEVGGGRFRRCFHCHQVKETLNRNLRRSGQWEREMAWRFPLPDNLGMILEVDRGNVVGKVVPGSAAAQAGLKKGDILRLLNKVPVHSIGDAQFALDRAPREGRIPLTWERAGKAQGGEIRLTADWRKSDITWRPSMRYMVASLPLGGIDLTADEKKALALGADALAFRQKVRVHERAQAAGIRAGDIIVGLDDRDLRKLDFADLYQYVRTEYLVGDRVTVHVFREGKRLSFPLTLP
jgi:serine protease Do